MSFINSIRTASIISLILTATLSFAKEKPANNNVYVELGGNALIYSVNYERNFNADWGMRLGLGALWADRDGFVSIPVMVNKYWGSPDSNHKFETGIGVSYFRAQEDKSDIFRNRSTTDNVIAGTATIGYRYLPKTSGMTFKIGFTPLFGSSFLPWLGFSVGHTF